MMEEPAASGMDEHVARAAGRSRSGTMPRIGVLAGGTAGDPNTAPHVEAFRAGLRALGYREGKNIAVECRYAEGSRERLPALLADLLALPVDVIVATGPPTIRAAQQA